MTADRVLVIALAFCLLSGFAVAQPENQPDQPDTPEKGPDSSVLPDLPDSAPDRAVEVLQGVGSAFSDGVSGLGDRLAGLIGEGEGNETE